MELRIQQKGEEFELERKVKVDGLSSRKEKLTITLGEFKVLKTLSQASIERDGFIIDIDDREVGIKVYHGIYEGLIRAESEFAIKEEAESYLAPSWFGAEITGTKLGKDSELIKLSREEFDREMGVIICQKQR